MKYKKENDLGPHYSDINDLKAFSSRYFSYDKQDILTLRADIPYIIQFMNIIKNHSNNKIKQLDFQRLDAVFDFNPTSYIIDETLKPYNYLEYSMKQCPDESSKKIRADRQGKTKCNKMKSSKDVNLSFHRRLKKTVNPACMKALTNQTRCCRKKGEQAGSVRSYKDDVF